MGRSRATASDPIALVEAAYDIDAATDEDWVAGLLRPGSELARSSLGAMGLTFDLRRQEWLGRIVTVNAVPRMAEIVRGAYAAMDLGERERLLSGVPAIALASDGLTGGASLESSDSPHVREALRFVGDGTVVVARNIAGDGCVFGFFMERRAPIHPRAVAEWTRITRHVAAGLRLRSALREQAPPPDAILDASGREHHSLGEAQQSELRAALREAVRNRERARGALRRRASGEALQLWRALVEGRWSLVDRFESDGRRYVVAHRNDPGVRDPRGLTDREQTVAEYVRLGHSNKSIAYSLGIAEGTVATLVHRMMRKLGFRSRAALVCFLQSAAQADAVLPLPLSNTNIAVLDAPGPCAAPGLTPRQQQIVELALAGRSNAGIAEVLSLSPHTVANTLRGVFRKLGVRSRADLARWASASSRLRGSFRKGNSYSRPA